MTLQERLEHQHELNRTAEFFDNPLTRFSISGSAAIVELEKLYALRDTRGQNQDRNTYTSDRECAAPQTGPNHGDEINISPSTPTYNSDFDVQEKSID